jgi:nicotinamidase-related amidase
MELGHHVTLVPDATAAVSAEGMKAAATNAPMYAHAIRSTEELVAQISKD